MESQYPALLNTRNFSKWLKEQGIDATESTLRTDRVRLRMNWKTIRLGGRIYYPRHLAEAKLAELLTAAAEGD